MDFIANKKENLLNELKKEGKKLSKIQNFSELEENLVSIGKLQVEFNSLNYLSESTDFQEIIGAVDSTKKELEKTKESIVKIKKEKEKAKAKTQELKQKLASILTSFDAPSLEVDEKNQVESKKADVEREIFSPDFEPKKSKKESSNVFVEIENGEALPPVPKKVKKELKEAQKAAQEITKESKSQKKEVLKSVSAEIEIPQGITEIKLSLNDRIAFLNNLFDRDKYKLQSFVENINSIYTEKEAEDFLMESCKINGWNDHKEEYINRIKDLIAQRYFNS